MKPSIRTPKGAAGERSKAKERSNGHYQLPEGSVPRLMPMGRFELAALRPAARAAIGLVVVVVVAILVLSVFGGGGSPRGARAADRSSGSGSTHKLAATHKAASTKMPATTHMTAAMLTQTPLYKAVHGINESTTGKGLLPPSSCKAMSTTMISCTAPHYAINAVVFQTFSSLPALYAAYETRVRALSGGPFQANFSDCSATSTNGEIAWNHDFEHSRKYPISMFTSGMITDDKAAGRMYCTFNNDVLDLVWTQDDGRVMAELTGAPHYDAFEWWVGVHHSIAFPGSPVMPGMSG